MPTFETKNHNHRRWRAEEPVSYNPAKAAAGAL